MRRGSNTVFRLTSTPVIVRISQAGADRAPVERQVAVARWLAEQGIPAVRPVPVEQPIQVGDRQVTLWDSVSGGSAADRTQYGNTSELGEILRRLHRLTAPDRLRLPWTAPFAHIDAGLGDRGLTGPDFGFLNDRADSLRARYQLLRFGEPDVVLHGDASVGNLLRASTGEAVLSDLDNFQVGPRQWDLVLTAMFYELYGWHTQAEYRAFVDAYGVDVREWDGYPVLRDIRELAMVVWVAGQAVNDAAARAEYVRRVRSLRTGLGRDSWRPL